MSSFISHNTQVSNNYYFPCPMNGRGCITVVQFIVIYLMVAFPTHIYNSCTVLFIFFKLNLLFFQLNYCLSIHYLWMQIGQFHFIICPRIFLNILIHGSLRSSICSLHVHQSPLIPTTSALWIAPSSASTFTVPLLLIPFPSSEFSRSNFSCI